MLPTPSTSHVDYSHIYEPAEDSFLLVDTLSSSPETAYLKERFSKNSYSEHNTQLASPTPLVLEIGPGSGVILAFITAHAKTIFGRADVLTFGVDVNNFACKATGETVTRACRENNTQALNSGVYLGTLNGDLSAAIRPGTVDLLIFNPPYVPTSPLPQSRDLTFDKALDALGTRHEEDSYLLSLSYAGGVDGMEVTDRLMQQIPSLLNMDRGVAYILLCKQNRPEDVIQRVRAWESVWSVQVVGHSGMTGGWEKLQVIKIWRT